MHKFIEGYDKPSYYSHKNKNIKIYLFSNNRGIVIYKNNQILFVMMELFGEKS